MNEITYTFYSPNGVDMTDFVFGYEIEIGPDSNFKCVIDILGDKIKFARRKRKERPYTLHLSDGKYEKTFELTPNHKGRKILERLVK